MGTTHDIIRVSLSNEDFLKKVETCDTALKKHIDGDTNYAPVSII